MFVFIFLLSFAYAADQDAVRQSGIAMELMSHLDPQSWDNFREAFKVHTSSLKDNIKKQLSLIHNHCGMWELERLKKILFDGNNNGFNIEFVEKTKKFVNFEHSAACIDAVVGLCKADPERKYLIGSFIHYYESSQALGGGYVKNLPPRSFPLNIASNCPGVLQVDASKHIGIFEEDYLMATDGVELVFHNLFTGREPHMELPLKKWRLLILSGEIGREAITYLQSLPLSKLEELELRHGFNVKEGLEDDFRAFVSKLKITKFTSHSYSDLVIPSTVETLKIKKLEDEAQLEKLPLKVLYIDAFPKVGKLPSSIQVLRLERGIVDSSFLISATKLRSYAGWINPLTSEGKMPDTLDTLQAFEHHDATKDPSEKDLIRSWSSKIEGKLQYLKLYLFRPYSPNGIASILTRIPKTLRYFQFALKGKKEETDSADATNSTEEKISFSGNNIKTLSLAIQNDESVSEEMALVLGRFLAACSRLLTLGINLRFEGKTFFDSIPTSVREITFNETLLTKNQKAQLVKLQANGVKVLIYK